MLERECSREKNLEKNAKEAKAKARKDAARTAEPLDGNTEEELAQVDEFGLWFSPAEHPKSEGLHCATARRAVLPTDTDSPSSSASSARPVHAGAAWCSPCWDKLVSLLCLPCGSVGAGIHGDDQAMSAREASQCCIVHNR